MEKERGRKRRKGRNEAREEVIKQINSILLSLVSKQRLSPLF